MDLGGGARLPRLQVSHGGEGVVSAAQDGGVPGWDSLRLRALWGPALGSWLKTPLSLMLTPDVSKTGERVWVPGAADMAPELSCWARPSESSSDKHGSRGPAPKTSSVYCGRKYLQAEKVGVAWDPRLRPLSHPNPLLPSPILQGAGHPSSLRSPASREGAGGLPGEGGTTGPRQGRGRAGEGLRERWPQGQMSGRPSSGSS